MLLLDRFLGAESSALDLATGVPVRMRTQPRATSTPILTTRMGWRLIDAGPRSPRVFVEVWARAHEVPLSAPLPIDGVRAALQDARDGHPRAVDLLAEDAAQWRRAALDIARESRAGGLRARCRIRPGRVVAEQPLALAGVAGGSLAGGAHL